MMFSYKKTEVFFGNGSPVSARNSIKVVFLPVFFFFFFFYFDLLGDTCLTFCSQITFYKYMCILFMRGIFNISVNPNQF